MPWHVIAQIGNDDYEPVIAPEEARFVATIDKPGGRHSVTQHVLSEVFREGLVPSETAIDLVHLAAMVYTADVRIWRGYSEDAWTRKITLHFPVTQPDLWKAATPLLTELLSFLTGDEWNLQFRKKVPLEATKVGESSLIQPQAVCLFSGGLDSFVGAIDLLSTGANVALVGHYGNKRDQTPVFESMKPSFEHQMLPFWFYLVPPKMNKDQIVESTMRAIIAVPVLGSGRGKRNRTQRTALRPRKRPHLTQYSTHVRKGRDP